MRVLIFTLGSLAAAITAAEINFDTCAPGGLPSGFTAGVNQGMKPGQWVVRADPDPSSPPNVLVQTDDEGTNARFPVCVVNGFEAKDVDVSVRFKALAGRKDQAAGVVWRYGDSENYYIVRANALEGNVVLYKMENGKRVDLKPRGAGDKAYGKAASVPKDKWNTLRVLAEGNLFSVFLNGEKLFDVVDETFKQAGKVGLWTKADSVTAFDDLNYSEK